MLIEKLPKFGERFIQLDLLRRRNARIRHHPIRDEVALEKPLGEPERLRPRKKQFLSLLNFPLSLRVEFVHLVLSQSWRAQCNYMRPRVQSNASQLDYPAVWPLYWFCVDRPDSPVLATALAGAALDADAAGAGADDFVA